MRSARTPFDPTPAPCYPSVPAGRCLSCARHRVGQPPPEGRFVVIDGSALGDARECRLYAARRTWTEVAA